ncbi:MAG TPA: VWA domain-containing protein, partial [Thermoanaerobaculia bacterium]|nr:VWA domain-containing protein [Thermoanaerobaculia bacterium]
RFLDPAGELIASPKFLPDENAFAAMLVKMRTEAPAIIDASERRRTGRTAEADLILGKALLELELPKQALERFERAAKTLREQKDRIGAQFAELNTGFAHFIAGHRAQGIQIIDGVIRNPETNDNAAEAWYLLGSIRRIEHNGRDAILAFRKAWDLATPDTAIASVAHAALASIDKRPIPPKSGAPAATVRVIPPPRKVVTGSAEFIADVDRHAASVDFYLDDVKVATANKPPFAVRINVGNIPRARNVRVIALDANRIPIGEASTTINDRADAFHVTITSPATELISGDTTIEADAHIPDDRHLTKLELYWKNARLATFTEPPFRMVFVAPKEFGYLRAVGTLDDGATAEDTKLVNAGGVSETVNVQGVTFIATVLGKDNKHVTGLTAKDLVVEEEGRRVDVNVRSNEEEPAMVGIAIDISSSMRPMQLDVIEIATALVQTLASEKTKVFLVVFDNTARILHPPSSDVASLREKLLDLYAAGGTTLFDGMIFALQQFQGIEGRRALVVISDGRDVASGETADAATRLAKSAGVPIY